MTTRRDFLIAAGSIAIAAAAGRASATPAAMQDAIRRVVGTTPVRRGKVRIDLSPLVDNGNAVPLAVAIDSPMTPADHVKAIHVFAERNPLPNVLSVYLGPRAGRARIATRIRLADTQTVTAIAALSDGSFWSDTAEVVVTLSACVEGLI